MRFTQYKKPSLREIYESSQQTQSLFIRYHEESARPLTFNDSLSPFPNYPFCTLGVLTAQGLWGIQKSIAFVVEDNYLLTCASNCYSHQHGEYSNITFKINSNRKHGYDTYKVAKVFISDQFKVLPQAKRKQFDYALLYIEGELNLIDRYGYIGFSSKKCSQKGFTYLSCSLNNHDELQFNGQYHLGNSLSVCLNGCPMLVEEENGNKSVKGFIIQRTSNSPPQTVRLNSYIQYQLGEWAKIQNGDFLLGQLQAKNMNQLSCIQEQQKKPINKISIQKCKLNVLQLNYFLEKLPFSSVSRLKLSNSIKIYWTELNLCFTFLKFDKYKNLKDLDLSNNSLFASSCKFFVEVSLSNLRSLNLNCNPIGIQGCRLLTTGKWPFLQELSIFNCNITNIGLEILCKVRWQNLNLLNVSDNSLNNQLAGCLEKHAFPRIEKLNLSSNSNIFSIPISWQGLTFLKSAPWKTLKDLILSNNLVGSKGCKLIKQSGITFRCLWLSQCHFDDFGVKWLCKADLSSAITLQIYRNDIRDKGCEHLSKTSMFKLQKIEFYLTLLEICEKMIVEKDEMTIDSPFNSKFSRKGIIYLSKAEWPGQAIDNMTRLMVREIYKEIFDGRINHRFIS